MTSKTIFKQVDFWLQLSVIFVFPIFYYLRVFSFFRIYNFSWSLENTFSLVFLIAICQILSAITNFLIYKSERSQYRKMYEILTVIFVITLLVINGIDSSSLTVLLALLFISPFLAFWYLGITFGEFKALNLKKWWQFPLVLVVVIFTLLVFLRIITPQSL